MNNEIKVLYQFEDFRLDAAQKCLWRDGDLVSLTPKALETLLVLIRHKGRVVEKDTLLNEVWADTFVEEATLAQNISTLRKVLGSQPDKQFIETIPRRGYRFVADVREIVADEEIFVVEKHRLTNLVATQEIHDSEAANVEATATANQNALPSSAATPLEKKSRLTAIFKKHKVAVAATIAVALALGVLFGAWALTRGGFGGAAASNFKEVRFTRLVSGNRIIAAALSPDGKYLATANRKGGEWNLQVRQTSNENLVEIVPFNNSQLVGLTFSNDSQSIFYVAYPNERAPDGTRAGLLYKIPMLGGVPQHLATDVDSAIAVAPDGVRFVFVRNSYKDNSSSLVVAGFDGRAEKILASRPMKKAFARSGPAWSPNGKTLACAAHNSADVSSEMQLLAIDAETGAETVMVDEPFQWVGQSAWLNDGSGVIFPAFFSDSQNLTDQVWLAAYPGGEARPVTNGVTGFYGVSITADAKSFVTTRSSNNARFWTRQIKPTDAGGEEPTLIGAAFSEISLVPQGMSLTPEREIVFGSTKNGNSDIWKMDATGEKLKLLTDHPAADYAPDVSPDGKFIVFLSNRSGISNVWRANADGTGVKQITASPTNVAPGITTDGKFAYYSQRIGDNMFPVLWKIPVEGDGGAPIQMTDKTTLNPKISPDGKLIACFYADGAANFGIKLTVISAENGALVKQFDSAAGANSAAKISWSPDSRKIFYIKNQDGVSTIYEQTLDAAAPVKVLESKNETIFRFALANDGSSIFYESGVSNQEVLLVKHAE